MDVWVVQMLDNSIVVCESNGCKQTCLDPVDDKILDRFVRDDMGDQNTPDLGEAVKLWRRVSSLKD